MSFERAEQVLRDAGMLGNEQEEQVTAMSVQPFGNEDGAIQPAQPQVVTDFTEIDSVIMGAPPAAQFKDVGATVVGKILRVILRQATDFTSKELKWWPDGSPLLEPVITLETADGPVSVYAGSRGMRDALREACRLAQVGLRPGGTLAIKYTANGTPFKNGVNAPKVYEAAYEPTSAHQAVVRQEKAAESRASRVTQLVTSSEPPF